MSIHAASDRAEEREVLELVIDILLSSLQHNTSNLAVESELVRWKNCGRLDAGFREKLPATVRHAVTLLASQFQGARLFRYDVCSSTKCGHVYRCATLSDRHCPCCKSPRYTNPSTGAQPRAIRTMLWMSIVDFVRCRLLEDATNAAHLGRRASRADPDTIADVCDSRLWKVRRGVCRWGEQCPYGARSRLPARACLHSPLLPLHVCLPLKAS